ncbi:MAG TPA: zf-HC2 domain-containing protein [Myxococcales bacterium]
MKQPADSCATVQELLLDYAYGELEGAPRKDVEAHVAGCASCRIALMQMTGTRSLMAELEPEPAPQAGLDSLLAYAEQASKHRAAEAKAPRASKFWSWLVPSLGFASAAAVALLFVVRPGGDAMRALQPALPATVQAPAPMAAQPTPPSPVVATAPAEPKAPAAAGDELMPKAEGKAEFKAKEQQKALDVLVADKNAEHAEPAKGPAKVAMKRAAGPTELANDDFEATFAANGAGGAGGRKGAEPQPDLAKDAKPGTVAVAGGAAQAQGNLRLAEAERSGKAGGGEAIGSPHYARQMAQAPVYGAVPPDQRVGAGDLSKTASAGMSNVSPLDGAKPAAMPAAKPAEPAPAPAAPPPSASSGYAEAKKRDAREESAPMAVAAAESAAKSEDSVDRRAATKSAAVRLSPEELLRKGADQSNNGDLVGAEGTYASFLQAYPSHPKAPDVALWRVELLERLGRTGDAVVARAEYARRWPTAGAGGTKGSSGPRGAAASPARAAPMEKAKAVDFDAATEAAH